MNTFQTWRMNFSLTGQQAKSNWDLRTDLFLNCFAVWIRPEDWFILKPFIRLNLIQTQGLSCSLALLHMNLFQIWGLNFSLNVQQSTSILGLCTELLFLLFSNLNLNQTWWLIFFLTVLQYKFISDLRTELFLDCSAI